MARPTEQKPRVFKKRKYGIEGLNDFELYFSLMGKYWLLMEIDWQTIQDRVTMNEEALLKMWNDPDIKYNFYTYELPAYDLRKEMQPFFMTENFKKEINSRPEVAGLSFDELREKTLLNIQRASTLLKNAKPKEIESYKIIFKNGDNTSEFPYWNILNGPLADALTHVGQVVSFRRSNGNPINGKVNVFIGKTGE